MIVTPNEDAIFTAVRSFLQDVLPPQSTGPTVAHEVVVGQENRVPEPMNVASPKNSNYVVIWPLRMPQLSTVVERLTSLGLARSIELSSECVFQLDVHGPEAFNNASIISTVFRSGYAVDFFSNLGTTISPLFVGEPRNMVFAPGGEQQYEDRYIVEAHLQVNQTVTASAQSATTLTLGIVSAETDPASWPNSTVTPDEP